MKRLSNWLGVLFINLVLLSGCASKNNDPKTVLNNFFDAMEKKDFIKAEKLSTAESKEYFTQVEKLIALTNSPYLQDSSYFNTTKITIGEVVIENQLAHIPVQVKIKAGGVGPFAGGYGFGARSTLLGYFLRFDAGWEMNGLFRGKPKYYFAMGLDF